MDARFDCRFYLGDRPCRWRRQCEGCEHYSAIGTRILIIKLAAAGDVLRTTAVLPPLRRKYDESHVTWVTDPVALPLVASNPHVDRAMPFTPETWLILQAERFDLALCLDKEPRAAALVNGVAAERSLGFGLSEWGTIVPLNEAARYDLRLGLDDELKFRVNQKTHPEIVCEIAEVEYEGERYSLSIPGNEEEQAREFLSSLGLASVHPLVGLNVGSGAVFANKAWTPGGFASLSDMIAKDLGGRSILLGGRDERARVKEIMALAPDSVVDGGEHELLGFAGLVKQLDALVTGDTLAMHLGVATEVPVVAIFGPTVPQEIDLFGTGKKIVSPLECAPCYSRSCDRTPTCMDSVSVDGVFAAVKEVLGTA